MPKFRVYGVFTATKCLGDFEAPTKAVAQEMGENSEENSFTMCHQCGAEVDQDDVVASRFFVEELK